MRLLSICPRVKKANGCIVAATAWRVRLLTLGAFYRKVVVDPACKTVTISRRYLWVFAARREIPFSSIRAVTYGYEDMSVDSSVEPLFAFAHDTFDQFTVGLRVDKDSELTLFNFIGDGTFRNDGPYPDWMYWDQIAFDMTGHQENESRIFVDVLASLIGVKVVPPRGY